MELAAVKPCRFYVTTVTFNDYYLDVITCYREVRMHTNGGKCVHKCFIHIFANKNDYNYIIGHQTIAEWDQCNSSFIFHVLRASTKID